MNGCKRDPALGLLLPAHRSASRSLLACFCGGLAFFLAPTDEEAERKEGGFERRPQSTSTKLNSASRKLHVCWRVLSSELSLACLHRRGRFECGHQCMSTKLNRTVPVRPDHVATCREHSTLMSPDSSVNRRNPRCNYWSSLTRLFYAWFLACSHVHLD